MGPREAHPRAPHRLIAGAGALLVLVLATFWNTQGNPFHLDDVHRVRDNPGITRAWPPTRFFLDPGTMASRRALVHYRPLLPLTLSWNHAVHGAEPAGYHLTNAGILAGTAFVAAWLARGLGASWAVAGVAAALLGVHPVSGVAVNYVCARDLQLMLFFLLLALGAYVRMRRVGESPARWAAVLGALALAMLSKRNAVAFPLLVLGYEATFGDPGEEGRARRVGVRVLLPVVVIGAILAFPQVVLGHSDWKLAQTGGGPEVALRYLATQLRLHLVHYLPHFAWPVPLRVDAGEELLGGVTPGVVLGALLVAGSLGWAWRARRREPGIAFAVMAYWAAFAPTSSVIPLRPVALGYRAYPSSVFLYLGLAWALERVLSRRAFLGVAAAAVVLAAGASVAANRTWRSGRALWEHAARYGTGALGYQGLALETEDLGERIRLLRRALELRPDFPGAATNLGLALLAKGEVEEGLRSCRRAVELAPLSDDRWYWLARCEVMAGRHREAAEAAARAVELNPGNPEYRHLAGVELVRAGKPGEAAAHLEVLLARDRGARRVRYFLGKAYVAAGEAARGRALLEEQCREDGGEVPACVEAAELAARARDLDGMIGMARAGLGRDPGNRRLRDLGGRALVAKGEFAAARDWLRGLAGEGAPRDLGKLLGFCALRLGEFGEAAREYEGYLEANPGDAEARRMLGVARASRRDALELR